VALVKALGMMINFCSCVGEAIGPPTTGWFYSATPAGNDRVQKYHRVVFTQFRFS